MCTRTLDTAVHSVSVSLRRPLPEDVTGRKKKGRWQMGRFDIPDHPEIECIERTGYPSWLQETDMDGEDYDREFWGDNDPWDEYC